MERENWGQMAGQWEGESEREINEGDKTVEEGQSEKVRGSACVGVSVGLWVH